MIQKACESYFIWNCLFIWICLAKFEDNSTSNPNPPMNFSWIKENEIAASGGPKNFENLKWIENQGIKHVLSLDQVSHSEFFKKWFIVYFTKKNVKFFFTFRTYLRIIKAV